MLCGTRVVHVQPRKGVLSHANPTAHHLPIDHADHIYTQDLYALNDTDREMVFDLLNVWLNWQVLNLRTDKLLITFKQEVGVTSLSFRTDASAVELPLLASTGGDGRICLWDLKERRLHHTMAAHDGGISKLQFLPR